MAQPAGSQIVLEYGRTDGSLVPSLEQTKKQINREGNKAIFLGENESDVGLAAGNGSRVTFNRNLWLGPLFYLRNASRHNQFTVSLLLEWY